MGDVPNYTDYLDFEPYDLTDLNFAFPQFIFNKKCEFIFHDLSNE